MVIVHIALIRFRAEADHQHRQATLSAIRDLRALPSVLNQCLVAGKGSGPSRFDAGMVSFHQSDLALEKYVKSEDYQSLMRDRLEPDTENLVEFDFEVEQEQGYQVAWTATSALLGMKEMKLDET